MLFTYKAYVIVHLFGLFETFLLLKLQFYLQIILKNQMAVQKGWAPQ